MIARLAWGLVAVIGVLLVPAPASAHPLGNFTTNQYAGLRISSAGVDVDYVLDLAELPAYQARPSFSAAHTCTAAAAAASLTVDGRVLPLSSRVGPLSFPPGAGGLTTLRLECVLHADASLRSGSVIEFSNGMFPERIGWREVTAVGDRYTIVQSDVPASSSSSRLSRYPVGTAGLDVRNARVVVRPGGPAAAAAPFVVTGNQARDVDRFTRWFTDLMGRPELSLGVGLVAVVIALVLGAAHAVAPGHGKTIMAAYLVGSRGRLGQALTVAGAVAATHTVGVLVLGVLLATSLQFAPDSMYAWLRLGSGVVVALVGGYLLWSAIRRRSLVGTAGDHTPHPVDDHHPHPHSHHDHSHAHDHSSSPQHAAPAALATRSAPAPLVGAHVETHTHAHGGSTHTHYLPAPDETLRLRTLLAMGFAGGLSPSPSAVVVLLGAAALGRAWYGVLLVLSYGIGLAATLIGIGFALAHWGERLRAAIPARWSTLLTHRMPAATATVILVVGLGIVAFAAASLITV